MRILVTGATGFIGGAFARRALQQGHAVAGLIRPNRADQPPVASPPGMEWIPGTLAELPWDAVEAFRADVCVHCAWCREPGVALDGPAHELALRDSRQFLFGVLQLGVRHVIGLGTCIEYKSCPEPRSESGSVVEPTTAYARCKDTLRRSLEREARDREAVFAWARVFYPYGPGEPPSKLCSSILSRLTCDEPVELRTPDSVKDYIHIDDLTSALLVVLERRHAGPINLATGNGVTIRDLAFRLARLLGKPHLVRDAVERAHDAFPFVVGDVRLLHSLGWRPATSLEAGLRAMVSGGAQERRLFT